MKTIVTHGGSFDSDDVLATAVLCILLQDESFQVLRSRDEKIIAQGDYVIDVGGVYAPEKNYFDHHQIGAPVRENGLPYSAFGLVWKHYGDQLTGSEKVSAVIEKKIVEPIDSADNHQTVCHPGVAGVTAFELFDVIDTFKPVWGSSETYDEQFLKAVEFAKELLKRLIAQTVKQAEMMKMVDMVYQSEQQKTVLVFKDPVPRHALIQYEDVKVVVAPAQASVLGHWTALVVPVAMRGFQNRVVFPETWAGLTGEDLAKVSGVKGAVFCHKERYIFVADSQAGAIKASHHALF